MMQPGTWPAITMVSAAFLTACASPTTPTPTPTYSCTTEQGGSPTPCSPNEHPKQRDATYKQAEAVYRRYWNELQRLDLLDEPYFTDVMADTTAGIFEDGVREGLTPKWRHKRIRGEVRLVRIEPLQGHSRAGSTVALQLCIDAREAYYVANLSDEISPGIAWDERVYLAPIDGRLKLVASDSKDVESC